MYTILLFLHFIGLALGIGIPIANLVAQRLAAASSPEGAAALRTMGPRLAPFSQAGLALLIVTGLLMLLFLQARVMVSVAGVWFWLKLLCVAGLCAVVFLLWQTANEIRAGNMRNAPRMAMLGPAAMTLSLATVLFAVLGFH